ncbi:hypothetical protein J7337_013790 [Fusarium musae]|uniref:MACPF-like domain-containing protein n=1 Tax=Fusarium musae TaxID=1042133 RepID=A0A9P8D5B5_9HYPO|nr:hypothetical protein J7337_013790 [Fusarium musae]KAG9495541.1 hypothetical protein J7337_013790 [Fusarium musae]
MEPIDFSGIQGLSGNNMTPADDLAAPTNTSYVFTIITIYAPAEGSNDDTEDQATDNMTASQLSRLKAAILAKLHVQSLTNPRTSAIHDDIRKDKNSNSQYMAWNTSFNIFITAAASGDANQLLISLLKQSFLLKFMRLLDGKNSHNEGSLQSSAFSNKSAAKTNLAIIRGFIETMSSDASQDVFCLPDGTPVPDTMPLEQYLGISKPSVNSKDSAPIIPVFIKKATLSIIQPTSKFTEGSSGRQTLGTSQVSQRKNHRGGGIDQSVIDKLGKPDLKLTDRSGEELRRDKSHLEVKETLHESDYAPDSDTTVLHASKLNEYEWDLILKNSNAFRGWIVDFKGDKIAQAPHPDIEIASVQHEFGYSMAQNHFDKNVFEVEGSGVVEGITLGANAAFSNEQSSGSATSTKQVAKTLIATYKVIPRATVYLSPEDLEPTEEFAAAIDLVRKTRNIIDLRKLHKQFGQIFCAEIVVGGCLQTSKILTAKEKEEENVQRNRFKGSVGIAVGAPQVANLGAKMSHETQDHSESGTRELDQRESLSFRATGGNTILAANPPAWISSVASDSNSWRIIQQGDIRPVMDMVSEIPGYEQVRMWFLQATPKLTEYIVIPQQRSFDARLKVDINHDGLPRALVGSREGDKKIADLSSVTAYLAHDPRQPPAHFLAFVKESEKIDKKEGPMYFKDNRPFTDVTTKIYQTSETTTKKIFEPAQTQAPVLFCPQTLPNNDPDIPGLLSDSRTVWTIEVPFGYSLTHNSLVTLKSQAGGANRRDLTLTVYRNAQGVFMPAITNHTDPVYWRVLKNDRSSISSSDQIKFGDKIRLCWRFSDQSSGWRDYLDDFYGRRRFDSPAELQSNEDELFLKSPFPRFEGLTAKQGASMLLSTVSDTDPVLEGLKVLNSSASQGTQNVTYNLFDLSFRLDFVGNNGSGEALDYMNVAFSEMSQVKETKLKSEEYEQKDQSALDVGKRMGARVINSHLDQIQNLANAVSKGSAVDVMRETVKTGFM